MLSHTHSQVVLFDDDVFNVENTGGLFDAILVDPQTGFRLPAAIRCLEAKMAEKYAVPSPSDSLRFGVEYGAQAEKILRQQTCNRAQEGEASTETPARVRESGAFDTATRLLETYLETKSDGFNAILSPHAQR